MVEVGGRMPNENPSFLSLRVQYLLLKAAWSARRDEWAEERSQRMVQSIGQESA